MADHLFDSVFPFLGVGPAHAEERNMWWWIIHILNSTEKPIVYGLPHISVFALCPIYSGSKILKVNINLLIFCAFNSCIHVCSQSINTLTDFFIYLYFFMKIQNSNSLFFIFTRSIFLLNFIRTIPDFSILLFFNKCGQENIFEWQFAIRGPGDTEFEGGIYHGRIQLPAEYPFKPPAFMLLTVMVDIVEELMFPLVECLRQIFVLVFSAKWTLWNTNQDLPEHIESSPWTLAAIMERYDSCGVCFVLFDMNCMLCRCLVLYGIIIILSYVL